MKKTIIAFLLLAVMPGFKPEGVLKVEADAATWNRIVNVIELSAAEPNERVAIKNFIINQLQAQLKPKADSTKKK